jgi:O-antigen ligase
MEHAGRENSQQDVWKPGFVMTDEPSIARRRSMVADRRYSPTVPSGPRLFMDNLGLAWLLLLFGSFSFTQRSAADVLSGQLSSSNLIRFTCILIALVLITPEVRAGFALRLNALWLFVVYVVVCVVSTMWSVSPVVTLGKAAELAVATAVVMVAANRTSNGRALDQLFKITFAFGALVLLFIAVGYVFALPGFWIQSKGVIARQMDTWFLSANSIGYLSALTAAIALDRAVGRVQGRPLMWAVLLLSVMTAFLAQGRTGLACLLLGAVAVLAIRRKYMILLAGAGLVLLMAIAFNQEILAYLTRGEPVGSLQTLTGRTVVWQGAWQSFMQHPWTGNGFGIGGRYLFVSIFAGSGEDWSMAHNGFLELLTGVGLLGLVPWSAAMLWTIANAFQFAVRRLLAGAPAIIGMMPVITFMSNGAAGWFDIVLAYFLCSVAILAHKIPLRQAATGYPAKTAACFAQRI